MEIFNLVPQVLALHYFGPYSFKFLHFTPKLYSYYIWVPIYWEMREKPATKKEMKEKGVWLTTKRSILISMGSSYKEFNEVGVDLYPCWKK